MQLIQFATDIKISQTTSHLECTMQWKLHQPPNNMLIRICICISTRKIIEVSYRFRCHAELRMHSFSTDGSRSSQRD